MLRKKILIVEDDEPIRKLLHIRLDVAGYHPVTATTGREAVAQVAATRPAAMILDIGLPLMDGFAVLGTLASRNLAVPTLVLTARNRADDVERAIGMGAWDFMAKPFDHAKLVGRLGRMLEGDGKRQQAWMI